MVPLLELGVFPGLGLTGKERTKVAGRFTRMNSPGPHSWAAFADLLQHNLDRHGDFPKWNRAVRNLPTVLASSTDLGDTVTVEGRLQMQDNATLPTSLQALHPWRKGPFSLGGVHIDSEWRCDFKWRRIAPHVNLSGMRVLDVGCGNGYYGWRMLDAGARLVVGIDPSVLYCMQHRAVSHFIDDARNLVLPLTLEELPETQSEAHFDAVFSMGVLYHRRDPLDHLRRLRHCVAPGGLVVVESLVSEDMPITPQHRYAQMRNVWHIPTPSQLLNWMTDCGFQNPRILDTTTTTVKEQRSTHWMRFHSLAEALDPNDSSRTIEGYPAPRRSLLVANR